MELSPEIEAEVQRLSAEGTALLENGDPRRAIDRFQKALRLVPEPRQMWSAATWLYTAIGDAELERDRLGDARDAFEKAATSADGAANPYVQLRYGQVLADLGKREDAADPLARAAMVGGVTLFATAADRLDLLELVDTKLKAPKGYDSWIQYAESMDWQEIENPEASEDSGEGEPRSLVDEYSSEEVRVSEEQALFWRALEKEDIDRVRELVPRVDLNIVIPGGTFEGLNALSLAGVNQNPALVQVLLEAGADPNAPSPSPPLRTPLNAAIGSPEATQLLLNAGADLESVDRNGLTALFMATETGDPEVVKLLVDRGANVHVSSEGVTLWEAARARGLREVVKLLERAGAKRPGRK